MLCGYLNRSLNILLGKSENEEAGDRHSIEQPGREAEEVHQGCDISRDYHYQRNHNLVTNIAKFICCIQNSYKHLYCLVHRQKPRVSLREEEAYSIVTTMLLDIIIVATTGKPSVPCYRNLRFLVCV